MKAIFVCQESCSGDSHEYPIATFSEDQKDAMEKMLKQLQAQSEKQWDVSFYIGDYDAPIHNPRSVAEIEQQGGKVAKQAVTPKEPVVSSYERNGHIGNEPLW